MVSTEGFHDMRQMLFHVALGNADQLRQIETTRVWFTSAAPECVAWESDRYRRTCPNGRPFPTAMKDKRRRFRVADCLILDQWSALPRSAASHQKGASHENPCGAPWPSMYTKIYLRLEPLGLEYVAQAARNAGHEVRLIDLQVEPQRNYISLLREWHPDVIAFSCNYLPNVPEIVDLARLTKHKNLVVLSWSEAIVPVRDERNPGPCRRRDRLRPPW